MHQITIPYNIKMKLSNPLAIICILACFGVLVSCKKVPVEPVTKDEPVKVTHVTMNASSATLTIGESVKLTATVSPSNAANQKILWSSSNISVASVEDGLVVARAEGKAIISAISDDGGKTAACEVTVKAEDIPDVPDYPEVTDPLFRKWYLGYFVSGSLSLKFDGTEAIDIQKDKLTWSGQQDPNGNGDYEFAYNIDNQYFTIKKSGKNQIFYIRELTEKILVLQEGEDGALRYWYPSELEARNAPKPAVDIPDPAHIETTDINTILSYRSGDTYSSKTPMGIHFERGKATTESDRAWLNDPANEPDYRYANENPNQPSLINWKEIKVTLYPHGEPIPADVNQHEIGDCSFCSVMSSMSYLYPDYIKHIITDNKNGTYTVKLYDPQGEPVDVTISSKFLCNTYGTIGQVTGKDYVPTWSTVLEKAVMKWETLYDIDSLWGIGTEFASPILTGDGRSFAFYPNTLWNSEWKLAVDWVLGNGMISIGGFTVGGLQCGNLTSVTAHAFAFMYTSKSEDYLFSMRNPWGITEFDGILDIPDSREVVSTIDMRYVYPGAAQPFLKKDIGPYIPPKFNPFYAESSVSSSILKSTGYYVQR